MNKESFSHWFLNGSVNKGRTFFLRLLKLKLKNLLEEKNSQFTKEPGPFIIFFLNSLNEQCRKAFNRTK